MSGTTASMPASLTDPAVVAFATEFGLTDPPVILTYQNEGYGPDWCHVSAKAQAIKHGGRRVHGWALWQYPGGLVGDFHSVWEDREGTLIDVTPPKFGGPQVMFLRDRVTDIYEINGVFAQPTNRMPPPHAPFWWSGHQTDDAVWGFNPTAALAFVAYCAELGFAAKDYPTAEPFG